MLLAIQNSLLLGLVGPPVKLRPYYIEVGNKRWFFDSLEAAQQALAELRETPKVAKIVAKTRKPLRIVRSPAKEAEDDDDEISLLLLLA